LHGWLTPILLSFASSSPSSPNPTALFPLVVGDAAVDVALIRSEVEAALGDRLSLRLLAAEQLAIDPARAAACGANSRCLADVYADTTSTLVLVVVINAVASPIVLSARLLDVAQARFVAEQYQDVRDEEELPRRLRSLITTTFDEAGHLRWATLHLDLEPPNARVELGSIAAVGGILRARPGPVEFTVRAEGYQVRQLSLTLEAGESRVLNVSLEPEPKLLASPWFWAGAAAVLVATAAVVTVLVLPERSTVLCLPPCD
jgi:hypothetical protein